MKSLKLKKDVIEQLSRLEEQSVRGGNNTYYTIIPEHCVVTAILSCISCELISCERTRCDDCSGEPLTTNTPPCKDITQTQPTPTEGVECGRTLYYTCNNCQL